jgi:hypothetical protein
VSSFPCLVRTFSGSGQVRYSLGDGLVDRYLEFVAGRCRPNTPRAIAFDLKAFFRVVGKDPLTVTAADVFDFLADQRGEPCCRSQCQGSAARILIDLGRPPAWPARCRLGMSS